MTQINAYINFPGNCREAMTFYKECLGGELTIQTVKDTPIAAQCPAAMQDQVMHASLLNGAILLMASDMQLPDESHHDKQPGNMVALSLNCSSEAEIRSFYEKLSAGGHIIDPLKQQFWGALFGVFTDKFGLRWMLNYELKK